MGNPARAFFSEQLNRARLARHMSISRAAALAGVPKATVQGWLNGRYLPTPALRPNYLSLVRELGLEAELPAELWTERGADSPAGSRSGPRPYLGLRSYSTADREYYFGRESTLRRLIEAIQTVRRGEGSGLVVLVGASGSGKSSLLAAGIAAGACVDGPLQDVPVGWFSPGTEPAAGAELVLVDQVEDLLRLAPDARRAALDAVVRLAGEAVVVLSLRADAWADALAVPELEGALSRPVLQSADLTDRDRRVMAPSPRWRPRRSPDRAGPAAGWTIRPAHRPPSR